MRVGISVRESTRRSTYRSTYGSVRRSERTIKDRRKIRYTHLFEISKGQELGIIPVNRAESSLKSDES